MRLRSSFQPLAWPSVVLGRPAELMAIQRQLDASQFWPPERLRAAQFRQLRLLLDHAAREVPFYAERLRAAGIGPDTALTDAAWSRIPILTRREAEALGEGLHARQIPATHGNTFEAASGGSTGVPVRVRKTALADLFWTAIHLREELWHRDDPRGAVLRIRRAPHGFTAEQAAALLHPPGTLFPDYGPPSSELWETGPVRLLDDRVPIAAQAALLRQMQPDYLYCFPANLRLLAAYFQETGTAAPRLRSVWTLSEVVDDDLRAMCRAVFGCRIVHNYTSAEGGYMALECPLHEGRFHVQAEGVLLEVLDGAGHPCAPGEIGRVAITPLHNFAMPLLRYEIGDEAELGGPCSCGRGLPVLNRIIGRVYDYLILPSGQRRRVDTGFIDIANIRAIREFQVVQRSPARAEIRVVLSRPLVAAEIESIHRILRDKVGTELQFEIVVVDSIPRTQDGKLRIFVSELSPPPAR